MRRLKDLREKKTLTQAQLSALLQISASAIGMYEQGRREPDNETLKKIANFFNVTIDYLLGNTDLPYPNEVHLPNENKKIPIIGTVRCGPNGLAFEYIDDYIYIDSTFTGDIRGFHCKGDSMTGIGIFDGDTAIVRMQETVENGELAVVVINGDEGTLKRVRLQSGVIVLESANSAYPPRIFAGAEMNNVKIVGKVIEIRRKF
jgi:repressor LexA